MVLLRYLGYAVLGAFTALVLLRGALGAFVGGWELGLCAPYLGCV
jgi:hypothetical protein